MIEHIASSNSYCYEYKGKTFMIIMSWDDITNFYEKSVYNELGDVQLDTEDTEEIIQAFEEELEMIRR